MERPMYAILARLGLVQPPPPPPPVVTYFRVDAASPQSRAIYAAAFRLVDDVLRAGR
jgi:hypothetical protein